MAVKSCILTYVSSKLYHTEFREKLQISNGYERLEVKVMGKYFIANMWVTGFNLIKINIK